MTCSRILLAVPDQALRCNCLHVTQPKSQPTLLATPCTSMLMLQLQSLLSRHPAAVHLVVQGAQADGQGQRLHLHPEGHAGVAGPVQGLAQGQQVLLCGLQLVQGLLLQGGRVVLSLRILQECLRAAQPSSGVMGDWSQMQLPRLADCQLAVTPAGGVPDSAL